MVDEAGNRTPTCPPPDNYPISLEELSHEWNSHLPKGKTNLFQTGRASMRAEIQILNQNCPNDHVWRWCDDMKGRNAFQVLCTYITFASEKRSLITHLLREMWKHHLHVSDLCSLATLPESEKWKAITGSAQFCQRDPNVRFTPSRVKSVNSEEVVRLPNLDLPSRQGKVFFFFFFLFCADLVVFLWNCPKTTCHWLTHYSLLFLS